MSDIDSDSMFVLRKFIATRKSVNDDKLGTFISDENIFRAHHHIDIGLFKCEICHEEFVNKSRLRKHRSLMHFKINKHHECEFCSKKFKLKRYLKMHITRSHSEDKMYRCSFCNAEFESADLISEHKRIHSSDQPYQCDICGNKFKDKSYLRRHKLILHGKRKLFFCESCQTSHSSSTRPIEGEPLECGMCSEKFEAKSGLMGHIIEMFSGDKVYECNICGTEVGPNNALYAHEVTHRRNFECIVCRKEFMGRARFIKHQQLHVKGSSGRSVTAENQSETQRETCYCDDFEDEVEVEELQDLISSPMETNLGNVLVRNECELKIEKSELHNKVESEEVPESISSTDATFENAFVKGDHIDDIGLFKCEFCLEEFVNKSRLRKHRSLMHFKKNKLHECEFCSKKFRLKRYLKMHLTKSHSEDKMYRCSFCNAGFESADLISEHKRIHSGEQPYQCDICGKKFKDKSYLRKHKRIQHGKRKLFLCESCQTTHSNSTRPIGEERLECGICSEKFESKSGLMGHIIEMFSGDKVYECDICGTEVGPNNALYAHEVTHGRNFECIVCRKEFIGRARFTRHQQLHVKGSSGRSVTADNQPETQTETCYRDDFEDEVNLEECEIKIEKSELQNKVESEEVSFENVSVKSEDEIEIEQHELHENQYIMKE